MRFSFYKYHGNGNDFVVADNRKGKFPFTNQLLVKRLCDRNYGVGADGLMLLEERQGFAFHMRYFNSDGKEGSMCGNGGRCIVHFAREIGLIDDTASFSGIDGPHEAIIDNGYVHIKMQDVTGVERDGDAYVLDTGSPHYVLFTHNLDKTDVAGAGREIRYSERYRESGINVNFVEISDDNTILIRTYERGVEAETLACGTGSVAAAICTAIQTGNGRDSLKIETTGGPLQVSFTKTGETSFTNVWLTGPAKKVFSGTLETDDLL